MYAYETEIKKYQGNIFSFSLRKLYKVIEEATINSEKVKTGVKLRFSK